MNYQETFITIAPDCPVDHSIVPIAKGDAKPVHLIQYELLTKHPYTFTACLSARIRSGKEIWLGLSL